MIISRGTAKSFYRAGALGLACLGLAFVPLPVCGQQTTPGNVVPIQVQPAKKTPMSVEERIEALRRALQQLEEQVRKQQGQSSPPKSAAGGPSSGLPLPGNPGSPWPANWQEQNKVIAEINRRMREVEEYGTLQKAARIKLGRKHAEIALLKAKSSDDPGSVRLNKAIEEVNRLMREDEENTTLHRAAHIMLGRAHKELALLKGKSAGSKAPSNVVPVAP